MKINFMSLGNEVLPEMASAQKKILMDFSEVFGGEYSFTDYGSEKSFIEALSKSVEEDEIVVLTTAPELFTAFKNFISGAFSLKTRPSRTLSRLIMAEHPELDGAEANRHATIPTDADAIISEDGLMSGYGIRADEQILLVLPLDDTRIDYLLDDGVFPYLRDNLDFSQIVGSQLETAGDVEDVPMSAAVSKASAPTVQEAPAAAVREDGEAYSSAFITSIVNKMARKNLTAAVADTKTTDFLRKVMADLGGCEDTIFFTPYFIEKGSYESDEYAVRLAKGAFDNSDKTLGTALTKVYAKAREDGSKEYYIYACISDGRTANEARVAAEPGETPAQLIYKAVEVLFRMIGLWADTGYAMPQYNEESLVDQDSPAASAEALEETADEPVEVAEEKTEQGVAEMADPAERKHPGAKAAVSILIGLGFAAAVVLSIFGSNIYGLLGA